MLLSGSSTSSGTIFISSISVSSLSLGPLGFDGVLYLAQGILQLAFHLLCGPARLTLFVASPLTSLALDTASYVFRFAFYAVFVHLQPSR